VLAVVGNMQSITIRPPLQQQLLQLLLLLFFFWFWGAGQAAHCPSLEELG